MGTARRVDDRPHAIQYGSTGRLGQHGGVVTNRRCHSVDATRVLQTWDDCS